MRMCDLAEQAQLSRSGLTRLVDRLERDGLLERCSCDHDARGAYACLTDAGRERVGAKRACTHLAVVREHFLSRFSEVELQPAGGHVAAHRALQRLLSTPAAERPRARRAARARATSGRSADSADCRLVPARRARGSRRADRPRDVGARRSKT